MDAQLNIEILKTIANVQKDTLMMVKIRNANNANQAVLIVI